MFSLSILNIFKSVLWSYYGKLPTGEMESVCVHACVLHPTDYGAVQLLYILLISV